MTADQKTNTIENILSDKKAAEIELISLEGKSILADYFVIATGNSITHIKSLAGDVEKVLKEEHDITPEHIEGLEAGRWILMDYGDVIVHLFHADERSFYNLEKLWRMTRS